MFIAQRIYFLDTNINNPLPPPLFRQTTQNRTAYWLTVSFLFHLISAILRFNFMKERKIADTWGIISINYKSMLWIQLHYISIRIQTFVTFLYGSFSGSEPFLTDTLSILKLVFVKQYRIFWVIYENKSM